MYKALKVKLFERDITYADMANRIGISYSAFLSKINRKGGDFSIAEAKAIAEELELTDMDLVQIFFTQDVASGE